MANIIVNVGDTVRWCNMVNGTRDGKVVKVTNKTATVEFPEEDGGYLKAETVSVKREFAPIFGQMKGRFDQFTIPRK